jgi:hypothetical protein
MTMQARHYAKIRIYTIWPANHQGLPALSSGTWAHVPCWFVLDVTDGLAEAHVVEGLVSHPGALHRATELRTVAQIRDSTRGRAA